MSKTIYHVYDPDQCVNEYYTNLNEAKKAAKGRGFYGADCIVHETKVYNSLEERNDENTYFTWDEICKKIIKPLTRMLDDHQATTLEFKREDKGKAFIEIEGHVYTFSTKKKDLDDVLSYFHDEFVTGLNYSCPVIKR